MRKSYPKCGCLKDDGSKCTRSVGSLAGRVCRRCYNTDEGKLLAKRRRQAQFVVQELTADIQALKARFVTEALTKGLSSRSVRKEYLALRQQTASLATATQAYQKLWSFDEEEK